MRTFDPTPLWLGVTVEEIDLRQRHANDANFIKI
jgi:hypothetical protein